MDSITLQAALIVVATIVTLRAIVPPLVRLRTRRTSHLSGVAAGVPALGPARPGDAVLFVVRPRRWQHGILRVIGVAAIILGALMALLNLLSHMRNPAGPLFAGVGVFGGGIALLSLARMVQREQTEVLENSVRVRRGWLREREFALDEIKGLTAESGIYGGIVALDASGKRIFGASSVAVGYDDLVAFLHRKKPSLFFRPFVMPTEW